MNTLPRKRIYATGADRSKANRQRRKEEREALLALAARIVANDPAAGSGFDANFDALPDGLQEAASRALQRQFAQKTDGNLAVKEN